MAVERDSRVQAEFSFPHQLVGSLALLLESVAGASQHSTRLTDEICDRAWFPDETPDDEVRAWIRSVAGEWAGILAGSLGADRLRPPRLNAAGWCSYCTDQGCQADRCVDLWLRSWWAVCEECNGAQYFEYTKCENCYSGMIEITPPAVAESPCGEVVCLDVGEGSPVAV